MKKEIKLTQDHQRLLEHHGHILVLGGPGSGKTTIALLKAKQEIRSGKLKRGQRILFLSFARATIARVAQQLGEQILDSERAALEINTYHGFAWSILQSHGYLLNARASIRLLPPHQAAVRLAAIGGEERLRKAEKHRLFNEEGVLHFDLFAEVCKELLSRSKRLTKIICDAYPLIILDEFQDTNISEWQLIQVLGNQSRLLALADAEQRIYEFRGADPARIGEFIKAYSPMQFDFGGANNRSSGTDIVQFGNDLLSGSNKGKAYNDVEIITYRIRKKLTIQPELKAALLQGIVRLKEQANKNWSIAILVPTKRMMLEVSENFEKEQTFRNGRKLPVIQHDVALDSEGPALAVVLIAGILEGGNSIKEIERRLIIDLCAYIRGKRGNEPPKKSELDLAAALEGYINLGVIRGSKRKAIVDECSRIAQDRFNHKMSGDVEKDWRCVQRLLEPSPLVEIKQVAYDSKYLRLLRKGALLRAKLGELWRENGNYMKAEIAVRGALLQEYFSASMKDWHGVNVMTIHKAKGKEFDEVFIYEGYHHGKIVPANASQKEIEQARLRLRVAVTRSVRHATILTPHHEKCSLL